jgi:enoyl-CoA hydratase/carnithine racemase
MTEPQKTKLHDSRPARHVRQLVLDDPETRNALTLALRAELIAALKNAAADSDCRAVIITGKGKTFASGSDIRMLAAATPDDVTRSEIRDIWNVLAAFAKPIVMALNGHALGGGLELALCGDIIIAAKGVKIGTPEPKLGIMPGGGATQRLVRALGAYRAARLLLTAEPIDADTAERWGLVSEVCEPADLDARALALAQSIAALPPKSMVEIKQVLRDGADLPLAEGLALEVEAFRRLFATADKREGMAAFLEKRPANFTGE